MSKAVETTSHKEIRQWIEERGGHPARVKGAEEGGILRVDFGKPEESLEEIAWDDFFSIFDETSSPSSTRKKRKRAKPAVSTSLSLARSTDGLQLKCCG